MKSLEQIFAGTLAARPGESAHVLLSDNRLALLTRLALADRATQSIDVQYYIIRGDLTGLLLVHRLMQAADRGVRVRVLVDDVYTMGQDAVIAAFAEHPHVEIRLFNAFKQRHPWLLVRAFEIFWSRRALTRRMHNKAFVVDRFAAVVGGRNLGDEYFDASPEVNFQDLDLVAFGPAANAVGTSFGCFWDSPAAHPIRKLVGRERKLGLDDVRRQLSANFERFRESDYLAALREGSFFEELAVEASRAYWAKSEVVFDDPTKIDPEFRPKQRRFRKRRARVTPRIFELVAGAEREVTLISPYFVPGARGTALFKALRARGVRVRVLTNSLAATDVPAVHAGYERYRRRLLKCGVEIWEMRADPGAKRRRFAPSSGASLHAKAFSIDGRISFVGSMNLDPRSAFLNTELGLVVESEGLALRIAAYHDELATLERSYRVSTERAHGMDRLRWDWIDAQGRHVKAHREPDASLDRRLISQIIACLPLERHL